MNATYSTHDMRPAISLDLSGEKTRSFRPADASEDCQYIFEFPVARAGFVLFAIALWRDWRQAEGVGAVPSAK